jgi:hypothetical protein
MAEGNMTPLRQSRIFRHITNPRNFAFAAVRRWRLVCFVRR